MKKKLMKERLRKITGVILLVSLIMIGFSKPFQQYVHIPLSITMFEGDKQAFPKSGAVAASADAVDTFTLEDQDEAVSLKGENSGKDEMILQLAGLPMKKVNVNVLKQFKVLPGGQSIGVKMNTLGVLVVGHHLVTNNDGKFSPGEEAGIKVGDMITAIDGNKIKSMNEVARYVENAGENGKPLNMTIRREQEQFETKLVPIKDEKEQVFKLGLYIRDSAAGIGTMTFYDPNSKKYGALGHVISDMDTKKPIIVEDGQIVESTVTSIEKGKHGDPGEKLARFSGNKEIIGNITLNSPFGIFGTLKKDIKNGVMDTPLSIGLAHQVQEGPAKILTVTDGNEVKAYDIEIVSTIPQKFPATKGMVIKVTDKDLLNKTGGIVQGMSGSPIIQNNKLIGAVTHVFVNDPTSGYGVHIEWMLHEAGINIYEEGQEKMEKAG
ncbi:stage IV sporulation protein B [Bacillus thermophilus]|uniref:Stage IV sporulation protein B n=2 Tax=Bacillaceae TaxID=186817 RepID=A0ABS2R288_9BACI|nr:stage IV sporulation protein B [Siminovitchia thermophila]